MAWTTPRTWVTSEFVTAAELNEQIRDNMNSVFPIGTLILRVANYSTVETAVEGRWLQCNGVAVSRTTYAALFAYLNGLTPALAFGTGDGSTTFNLPDLRGRTPYGQGQYTNVDQLGDNEGIAIASRGPHHHHTITIRTGSGGSPLAGGNVVPGTDAATNGGGALDTPGYLVAGSYFIKYTA